MKQLALILCFSLYLGDVFSQDGGTTKAKVFWMDKEPSMETIYFPIEDSENGIPYHRGIQSGIEYLNEAGEKEPIEPWDIDRLEFEYRGAQHAYVSTNYDGKRLIMRVDIDGKLRMLEYRYTSRDDYNNISEMVSRVLSIEGADQGKNTKIYVIGFKGAMKEFFSNYPDMVQKVKKKEFTYKTAEEMVRYFNDTYGK
jgi:hypothetical protein